MHITAGKVIHARSFTRLVRKARPSVESRIRTFYVYEMLVSFQLWSPFWTLWLFAHANPFQATLVDIVFWTVGLLVTMPAGAIADRYGRKPALLLGASIWIVGIVLFGLADSLFIFALANGIWAFGAAFLWGTGAAYLFDTLAEGGIQDRYPQIMSRVTMFTFLATAIAASLGGLLVHVTGAFNVPLLLYAVPGLLALGVVSTFHEPAVHRMPATNLVAQIRGGLRTTRGSRQIVLVIVFQVLISVVTYVMAFFRPVFIADVVQRNNLLLGLVYGGFFGVAAVSGLSIGKLLDRRGETGALWLTFALVFPPFLVVYAVTLGIFPPGVGLAIGVLAQTPYYVIWGFEGPVITTIINRRVESSDRATVLAISSFFTTLALAIFEPMVGLLVTWYGIGLGLVLLAASAILPTAYVVAAYGRRGREAAAPVITTKAEQADE